MNVIKMHIANCQLVELSEDMFIRDRNNLQNLIIENTDILNLNKHSLAFGKLATVILLHVKKIRFRYKI